MQNQLNVSLVQTDLIWEDAQQNRIQLETKIRSITADTDLVVLPEMFSTGFSMEPKHLAETMSGATVNWMTNLSKELQTAICGSLIIKVDDDYFNRFIFADSEGQLSYYDKRHLFTLAGEHKNYKGGEDKRIISYKGWNICPMICYDLRFPVWSRNTENYDLLIYVANWPKPRTLAWDTLLKARAIENMTYTIGVNRVGTDMNDLEYVGHSNAYDSLGEQLTTIPSGKEEIITVTLNKEAQDANRKRFNFLNDRDWFTLK